MWEQTIPGDYVANLKNTVERDLKPLSRKHTEDLTGTTAMEVRFV
jgi:hypothetical protein